MRYTTTQHLTDTEFITDIATKVDPTEHELDAAERIQRLHCRIEDLENELASETGFAKRLVA